MEVVYSNSQAVLIEGDENSVRCHWHCQHQRKKCFGQDSMEHHFVRQKRIEGHRCLKHIGDSEGLANGEQL